MVLGRWVMCELSYYSRNRMQYTQMKLMLFVVWLEGLGQLKNLMTSSGTEPMTFWLVA
jgi:hypothetical protein